MKGLKLKLYHGVDIVKKYSIVCLVNVIKNIITCQLYTAINHSSPVVRSWSRPNGGICVCLCVSVCVCGGGTEAGQTELYFLYCCPSEHHHVGVVYWY